MKRVNTVREGSTAHRLAILGTTLGSQVETPILAGREQKLHVDANMGPVRAEFILDHRDKTAWQAAGFLRLPISPGPCACVFCLSLLCARLSSVTERIKGGSVAEASRISRRFSQRSVMEAIVQAGPISRASIAKQTGLSKQTISEIVRLLEQEGWVEETGRTSGHVGRSAVTYELVVDAAFIVAVDLGGTKVRVAITDLAGQILVEETMPTGMQGGDALVKAIAALALQAAAKRGISRGKIRLAVIGVPGAPDHRTGRVLLAPNIRGFDAMDVAAAFESAFGVDVLIENDVNLAVLGEHWQGRGQGVDNLAYVALGTGIGGGLIVGGQLVKGAGNAAGELGFLPIAGDPFGPAGPPYGRFREHCRHARHR